MATVDSLIGSAQSYASEMLDLATTANDSAIKAFENIGYEIILPGVPGANTAPLQEPSSDIDVTPPEFSAVEITLPTEPAQPTAYEPIPPVDAGVAPSFTAAAPTLTLPTLPSQAAAFTGTLPPINTNLVFPEPPAALTTPLLDAPVLPTRSEPVAPQIALPGFSAVAPVDTSVAPTNIDQTVRNTVAATTPATVAMMEGYVDSMIAKYNPQFSAQMAAIEAQLTRYAQGGTGLNAAVENAIYERSRTKQDAEAGRVRDGLLQDFANRGFTMPGGALFSAMRAARQAAADNNAQAAREIVVMQAEMEQKNLQFAVNTSLELRKVVLSSALSYHQNLISINGQAIEFAKTVMQGIISTYNAAVESFKVRLDAYRAEGALYETRLKSALAGIDLYKSQIQALESLAKVDLSKVEVYRARIEALSSLSNVYRSQIEAVQGRAGLEKLKIDLFQSQVQAYAAQVSAKNAEYQGFSAALQGQESLVRTYQAQANVYNTQVEGYRAQIAAKTEVAKAVATSNAAAADQYRARIDGYRAIVGARSDEAKIKLDIQSKELSRFQSEVELNLAEAKLKFEHYRTRKELDNAQYTRDVLMLKENASSRREYGKTLAELNLANAKVHGQLAASAIAGMTAQVSQNKNE